jgi:membrane-associated protease RseP (regulator of RpoE activity)
MSESLGIVLFVLAILTVVLVHEAGHFFSAKLFKIKVEEFFVGFGPRLWSFRRGETEYGVKALPLGGSVRIAGMNPFQEIAEEELPRTFGAKPIWQRALVIFAGPVTHFVIAILILAVFLMAIGVPNENRPLVGSVEPTLNGHRSPAAVAGLRPGDEIVALDGRPAGSADDVIAFTRAHNGEPIAITVLRDGRRLTLSATPEESEVEGSRAPRIGVLLEGVRERTDPLTAIGRGVIDTGLYTKLVFLRLGDVFGPSQLKRIGELLVGNSPRRVTDPTSIVGAARVAGQAAQEGWDRFFNLLVVLNIFVGIINLLPLPPLDGGHLAVLAYEKVRGRKPDVRKLVPVSAIVAGFLILFTISLVYLDIVKPLPNPFR